MGKEKATLVFSKDNNSWGSFYYKPEHDALRVDVPVGKTTESMERLKYEFSDQTDNSAVITMYWEKVKIPFKVSVDLVKEQVDAYRDQFDNGNFYSIWQRMQQAANYCLVNNVNLEEALGWSERSITTYFGEENFLTLSTYAGLLEKNNKKEKADSVMKKAMPMATMLQMNQYGYSLLRQKKYKEAYDTFKANYTKYPNDIYTRLGMILGNVAIGNTKEALAFGAKANELAEGDANTKAYVDKWISDIKAGKNILPQ
jgi:tetratricopeptide (TPR) repeat protein